MKFLIARSKELLFVLSMIMMLGADVSLVASDISSENLSDNESSQLLNTDEALLDVNYDQQVIRACCPAASCRLVLSGPRVAMIPYASGILAGIVAGDISVLFPLVMGFGSSDPAITLIDPVATISRTSFAFTVPAAGTLHDLRVSVDANFLLAAITPIPATAFTFTLLISPCAGTSGSATLPYVATGLNAIASFPATTLPISPSTLLNACGTSTGSIPVSAGDRVVLQITSNQTLLPGVTLLGLSAGLLYSPA